jgi:hypothetical protein
MIFKTLDNIATKPDFQIVSRKWTDFHTFAIFSIIILGGIELEEDLLRLGWANEVLSKDRRVDTCNKISLQLFWIVKQSLSLSNLARRRGRHLLPLFMLSFSNMKVVAATAAIN